MKPKVLIGSAMAAALLGIGVLAGGVVGADRAAAQTSSATPSATAQAQTTPVTPSTTPGTITPPADAPFGRGGGGGGRGHGGGRDGFGGDFGRGATADGASRAITNTTGVIDLVEADLAFANGKMDTTDVQRWVNQANTLLQSAQNANSSSQFGQAVAYAGAARELALTAQSQIAQELGASTLPSYSQLSHRGDRLDDTATTVTQAQASRVLAEAYNRLVSVKSQVDAASNAAEATPYLTDAQAAYQAAYNAYQAGNYNDAVASARLAGKLGSVANSVARASTAPANADTPVTVPAPNF